MHVPSWGFDLGGLALLVAFTLLSDLIHYTYVVVKMTAQTVSALVETLLDALAHLVGPAWDPS